MSLYTKIPRQVQEPKPVTKRTTGIEMTAKLEAATPEQLHPVGEQLSEAIWNAARFALDSGISKRRFVALVTKAADEAFDSHILNAKVRARDGGNGNR
jgi:hypothetical protein